MARKKPIVGYEQAPRDVLCRDEWPLPEVRGTALRAYKALHDGGAIDIAFPVTVFPGTLVISYTAAIPQEWVHDELKLTEGKIRSSMECEKAELERQMLRLMDADGTAAGVKMQDTIDRHQSIIRALA